MSDDPVIAAALSFDSFYRDQYRAVLGLVYSVSGSRWAAEDLTQEAFLRAHRDWARIGRHEAPGAWVRRVALNLATSRFRRLAAETRALTRLIGLSSTAFPTVEPHSDDFWRLVRALPNRQAQVVALFYLEDRPVREIATVLQISEPAVRGSLFKARAALARMLGVSEEVTL